MSNKDYLKQLSKVCENCSLGYNTIWTRQRYCSKSCYMVGVRRRSAEWQQKVGPAVYNKNRTKTERDLRIEAIRLLGNKCKVCGYSDIRALHIDHVHSDGGKERSTRKKVNRAIVRNTTDRSRYQILCANCNWIKRIEKNEGTNRPDLNDYLMKQNEKSN